MTSKERNFFRDQFKSICLLRQSFLGISRLFYVGVVSTIYVVYSQSPGHDSASIFIFPEVCLEISIPCVEVTRFLLNISSAALLEAYNNIPLLLHEEWSKLLHGWLPLVNQSFEDFIDTLSNLHCHLLDDVPHIFRSEYLAASSADNVIRVVINMAGNLINAFYLFF